MYINGAVLTIGDEILIGQIIDTNSSWISEKMLGLGIKMIEKRSVGDNINAIIDALNTLTQSCEIVFITGGLGPTRDDITKSALCSFLKLDQYFDQTTFEHISQYFTKLGRHIDDTIKQQCYMPIGAQLLPNRLGTAPGMLLKKSNTTLIALPGVPYEMKCIIEDAVIPHLISSRSHHLAYRHIMTAGYGETHIESRIASIIATFPDNISIAFLPSLGVVRLRISGHHTDRILLNDILDQFQNQIVDVLNDCIFALEDISLEEAICRIAISKNIKIGGAESCTGGRISSKLVQIPGASAYYEGSIVSYSNILKNTILNVKNETLQQYGAVSEQTVTEMVNGANALLKTHVAFAISGIAGPTGGTEDKPVGTIWIAVGDRYNVITKKILAPKERAQNLELASNYALLLLYRFIKKL